MLKKLYAILLLLILISSTDAMASHIVGGDFTYRYLGDTSINGVSHRKYKVSLYIYQDCLNGVAEAISDDNPAFFTLYENDGSIVQYDTNIVYDATPNSGGSISVPANFSNDCVKNIPQLCLYRKRFEKTYYLKPSNVGYVVVYQRCCRNANIANLVDPGDKGASYYCVIPRTALTNNSAVFKNYPPQVICQSNPLYYDNSATDADGDSLSYEFCPAEEGASGPAIKPRIASPPPFDTVDYYPPYNYSYCMPGFPPVQIDSRTGIITGSPNRVGRYLVTVCCTEWRNGNVINITKREFQFVVTDCSKVVVADIPQLSTAPNTYIVNCKDFNVHFINNSSGGFAYKWDFGVEGNAGSTDFEPNFVYPDTGTYVVKLIVNPGTTCPDSISRFVKIYPVFHSAFEDTGTYCPGLPIKFFDKSTTTIKPIVRWSWDFGDGTTSPAENPVHTYTAGGTYNVIFSGENIKNCVDTSISRVVIQDFKPFAGNDTVIVKGEYIQFNAKGGTSYAWLPDTHLSDTAISNPIGTYADTGTHIYSVYVKSSYGCDGYDTVRVLVVPSAYFAVPTAFSPNGDGKNDLFRPKAAGYRTLKYFRVYNRYGQEVFYGQSIDDGWNGTFNGKPADLGVYFWHICYIDRFGNEGFTKGDVTLMR